jgi:hypothetical protein
MDIFSRRIHMCVSETLETCLTLVISEQWAWLPSPGVSHWPHLTHFIVNVLSAVRISCLVTNRLDQILSHSEPTLGGAVVISVIPAMAPIVIPPFRHLAHAFKRHLPVSHRP